MKALPITAAALLLLALLTAFKPPRTSKHEAESGEWVENKSIYGKWEWFKTECCGTKKGTINTESFGEVILLDINPDNTFIENSKRYRVPRTGEVFLSKESSENETYQVIRFNDERPARYTLSSSGDTLILTWAYLELQTEYYFRK